MYRGTNRNVRLWLKADLSGGHLGRPPGFLHSLPIARLFEGMRGAVYGGLIEMFARQHHPNRQAVAHPARDAHRRVMGDVGGDRVGEFAPHHWDDEVAQAEGFPGAFAMAPLQHAFLHALLREWIGGAGRIVAVNMKLRSPFIGGRTLSAGGQVTAIRREDREVFIDLDVWQDDDEGTRLAPGTATVALSG